MSELEVQCNFISGNNGRSLKQDSKRESLASKRTPICEAQPHTYMHMQTCTYTKSTYTHSNQTNKQKAFLQIRSHSELLVLRLQPRNLGEGVILPVLFFRELRNKYSLSRK